MYKNLKVELKLENKEKRLLKLLCHIAKNLYNSSLYELRQYYFKCQKILSYYQIKEVLKNNSNYKLLHPYIAAGVINESIKALKLYQKYHNYDGTIKSYYVNDEAAKSYSFPKYKKTNGYFPLSFTINKFKQNNGNKSYNIPMSNLILNNYIFKHQFNDKILDKFIRQSHLEKTPKLEIILPRILYNKTIKSVKLVPIADGEFFELHYLYEIVMPKISYSGTEDMAIDLGVTNLATCITTNLDSFILDGKIAKSNIRLYNKLISNAKSKLPYLEKNNKSLQAKSSKKIKALYRRINNILYSYANRAANILLNRAIENKVCRIIIGWNEGFKQNGINNYKMTKAEKAKHNQSFINMPLGYFRDAIIRKSKFYNIKVIIIDEKFTSKVSFYDNEPLNYHIYWGERVKRGLYKRPNGITFNADINGALNIYRKFIIERSTNMDKLNYLMCSGILTPSRLKVL